MVEVDEAPKERERDFYRGCWLHKERRRIATNHHHPLTGTLSFPCSSSAFSSLFYLALSAAGIALRPTSETKKEEGQRGVKREDSSKRIN
jgi:hypothetical protein